MVNRFDVYLVALDLTLGSELRKTRPAVIISPNEANKYLNTVIIAPLTRTCKNYPSRVNLSFQDKKGQVVLDQVRVIDKARLLQKIGQIDARTERKICMILQEMFEY